VELTNDTGVPFSTGPALALEGFLPLAQELLGYTPVGGRTRLPLTVAVDLRGELAEEEISRDPSGIHLNGTTFVKVSRRVKYSVSNFKKEPVDLELTCQFGGHCTQASSEGKITKSDFRDSDWTDFRPPPSLVGHSQVAWSMKLAAGEARTVQVEYFYYAH
jgi:hypothetical protein